MAAALSRQAGETRTQQYYNMSYLQQTTLALDNGNIGRKAVNEGMHIPCDSGGGCLKSAQLGSDCDDGPLLVAALFTFPGDAVVTEGSTQYKPMAIQANIGMAWWRPRTIRGLMFAGAESIQYVLVIREQANGTVVYLASCIQKVS